MRKAGKLLENRRYGKAKKNQKGISKDSGLVRVKLAAR